MSVLYIGNTTKKVQYIPYRLPEDPRRDPLMLVIQPGAQEMIPSRNLSPMDIEAIVAAHRPYGMIPVEEVNRTKPYIGTCYSVDKVIPLERLQVALKHNDELLDKFGREIRQAAAVNLNRALEEQLGGSVNELEISIEEEKPDAHQGDGDAIGKETVMITNNADPSRVTKTPGKGRRSR